MSDARPTAQAPGRIRPGSRRDRPSETAREAPDPAQLGRQFRRLRHRHDELLRQLRLAEQVQRSLLPHPLPTAPHTELAAGLRPTQHLAGDFYNAFRLDGDHVGFYVGDVMGHGPAAALLAVFALMTIRTKRIDGNRYEIRPPAEVLADLNHTLLEADIPGQPFLTLVYGILDTKARTWTYSNGGHPHPIVLGPEHEPIFLEPTGPLLGVLQMPFEQAVVPMETGDRVVLYSDGAMTASWGDDGYGTDGLVDRMKRRGGAPLQGLIDDALASVSFESKLADDIAILAVELQD